VTPRWPDDWKKLRFAPLLGQARATIGPDGLEIDMPDRAALLRYERPAVQSGPEVDPSRF
jgi:hypothetical protein